jgi:hypothetical protein
VRRYLLDTTPLAAYLNRRPTAIDLIGPWIARREATTSVLAYGEVVEYIKGSADFDRRLTQLQRLLHDIHPYFLTLPILERYADTRRQLRPPFGARPYW